jgi:hypothetical protein
MRSRFAAVLLIVCSVASVSAQKTRFGQGPPKARDGVDYPITIHVSGIHLRKDCTLSETSGTGNTTCDDMIYADAQFAGKKIELRGFQIWYPGHAILLVAADYQARLVKAPQPVGPNPIGTEYELLMPDRTIWRSTVTGFSE